MNAPPLKRVKTEKDDDLSLSKPATLVNLFGNFTFRLERRTFNQEERILIFRSDRRGAIAKIVFSWQDGEAKIHVLECKEGYRGHDLGGLLFTSAVSALRQNKHVENCLLDAEEDERRYNRLVNFYEQLGCSIKQNAKVRFINNNDGETYRKVPMQKRIEASSPDGTTSMNRFLPVTLLQRNGRRSIMNENENHRLAHWLLLQDDNDDTLELRTTTGARLEVTENGICEVNNADRPPHKFKLSRFSDYEDGHSPSHSLWMIRSVDCGYFLALKANTILCSKFPIFWQVVNDYNLMCTTDTPRRRQHYLQQWKFQCVEYVEAMKRRYLRFDSFNMTLVDALRVAETIPAFPFAEDSVLDLKTRCFLNAEAFRKNGHPDWVQLVALIYHLGRIVRDADSPYDWTFSSRSRVLGFPTPETVVFGEFKNHSPDGDSMNIYEPHCGLDNVLLTWTGPEYMYHMLKHNQVNVPNEGLAMLRLASLEDWHSKNAYAELENEDDQDTKFFVVEFDVLLDNEVDEDFLDCDYLWNVHYRNIAVKCNADHLLDW